ncbi:MAG: hypothetical protein KAR65_10060 [Anaerolineales bacterium]|nr:hypothetical protein [Anaerolineales bacterium]MCK5634233.1 hypothetical protein [Anaerolineales bacterium]
MKRIECSEFRDEEGIISLESRIRGTMQHGLKWYAEMEAQNEAYEKLSKTLGREHLAIFNLHLPGTTTTIPMLLLSPQGVRVILTSPAIGVYRAKGEAWMKYGGGRSRRFAPVRPNMQSRVQQMAQEVHSYLQEKGYALPEVEAILLFTNPKTHIDTSDPRARIVQADAIDHFAANVNEFQAIMNQDDILELTEVLTKPTRPKAEPLPEPALDPEPEPRSVDPIHLPEDSPTELDAAFDTDAPALSPRKERSLKRSRFPFSRRQWILLAILVFFEVIILSVLTILVISYSFYG